jgi:hypothetical protein
MTLKMMVTTAAVAMVAGALCGCSAVPPSLQNKNAYGSVGRATPGGTGFAATSPQVQSASGRVIGADPDVNVRFDMNRNSAAHVSGGDN